MKATTVGRTVRWARRRSGMTQHDLAEASGVPQPSIARIESGAVTPRAATLIELLEASGHRISIEPLRRPVETDRIKRQLAMQVPRRTQLALGSRAKERSTSPVQILRVLRRFNVPFVLLGDLAEVAHGSPEPAGKIVEISVAATDVARERLAMVRDELGARADELRVTEEDYERLVGNAAKIPVDSGVIVRVAAVEDLMRIRRARGKPKDLEVEAELAAILDVLAARRIPL